MKICGINGLLALAERDELVVFPVVEFLPQADHHAVHAVTVGRAAGAEAGQYPRLQYGLVAGAETPPEIAPPHDLIPNLHRLAFAAAGQRLLPLAEQVAGEFRCR